MKTGDCLLWRSRSALGWLIRKFSKAPVNHAGLVIRFASYAGIRDRRWTLEALSSGVELSLLSKALKDYKGQVVWLPLDPRGITTEQRDEMGSWAMLHHKTPYDFSSLFKQVLVRVSVDAKRFFCSEYCYLAWKAAKINGLPKLKHAPRPGDLPLLGIFTSPVLIYNSKEK